MLVYFTVSIIYTESNMKLSLVHIKLMDLKWDIKNGFIHVFAKTFKIKTLALPSDTYLLILINFNFEKCVRIILS